MFIDSLIVFLGGLLIIVLAYFIIKRTTDLAKHYGFSGTFMGMTLLSIGTTLPEILTHILGSLQILNTPSLMNTVSNLVVGTNVGSDIFQQQFILGIVAILGTLVLVKKEIPSIIGGLVGSSVILFAVSVNGFISRWEGLILFLGYFLYLFYLNRKFNLNQKIRGKYYLNRKNLFFNILFLFFSFILMAFLADLVLKSSRVLIKQLPISASFFGIVVLGVIAALPELATALVALKKKEKGMSVGVLIGSNITNPSFALGVGALISTYTISNVLIWYDLPFKILGSLVILFFLWTKKKLSKKEALILIGMFVIYLIARNIFFSVDF